MEQGQGRRDDLMEHGQAEISMAHGMENGAGNMPVHVAWGRRRTGALQHGQAEGSGPHTNGCQFAPHTRTHARTRTQDNSQTVGGTPTRLRFPGPRPPIPPLQGNQGPGGPRLSPPHLVGGDDQFAARVVDARAQRVHAEARKHHAVHRW